MPVRRFRFLALAVFASIALFLFTRSTSTYENYKAYAEQKYENAVGGGSVLRPDAEAETKEHPEQAAGPPKQDDAPVPAEPKPVAPEVTSSARLVDEIQATSSSEKAASTSSLTQPLPLDYQDPPLIENEEEIPIELGQGRYEIDGHPPINHDIHWSKLPEHFPVTSTIQIPAGKPSKIPKVQHNFSKAKNKGADQARLDVIRAAAAHAWNGYREKAWGHDEVKPISGKFGDPFNGWGATLVDGLDTLWIMGMKTEFEEAIKFVETIDFTTTPRMDIPLFETTIRYLGGLIAAYEVSGAKYRVLLDKAVELAEVLYSAFDTPNRMPETYYHWKPTFSSQPHRASTRSVLAEIGSLSMEFTRLAQLSKESKYYDAIARITDAFDEFQNRTRLPGMWPTYIDASGCAKPAQMNRPVYGTHVYHPDGSGDMMIADQPVQGSANAQSQSAGTRGKAAHEIIKEAEAKVENENTGKAESFENPVEEDRWTDSNAKESDTKEKRQLDAAQSDSKPASEGDSSNATSESTPSHPVTPLGQTGAEVCIPQGLGSPNKHGSESYTLAGMSDSTYEYLPKMHLLLGGRIDQYKDMYNKFADVAIEKLIYRPMTKDGRDILASGDLSLSPNTTSEDTEMIETFKPVSSHLVCFAGGMFALGGVIFDRPEDVEIGKKLTDGCIWAYNVTATGIMPEDFLLSKCDSKMDCQWNETKYYEELDPYRAHRLRTPKYLNYDSSLPARLQGTDYHHRNKRQLDSENPAESGPEAPSTSFTPPIRAADADKEPLPDLSASKTSPEESAPPLPKLPALKPLYTPPPPLSHEDYVAKKIADERLPPGFTSIKSSVYILRPEAIESVFYLYRITGDQYWRDRGWEMFTAIQDHTGAVWGNSAIDDVTKGAPDLKDSSESFWIAETLKYFYLLFDEPEKWSLDDWVLNTEAHFFKRT